MLRSNSLQQKMVLYLLLPVAALLAAMGWFGFTYARTNLLRQWQEAAILKLQRAAHQVDMRLSEPKFWLQMFNRTGGEPQAEVMQKWIVKQLDQLQGIERASLIRLEKTLPTPSRSRRQTMWMQNYSDPWMKQWGGMDFERAEITQVNPPHYDAKVGIETVAVVSDLLSARDEKIGRLELDLRFSYLIENALSYGWQQEEMASLIDDEGKVLTCSTPGKKQRFCGNEWAYKAVLKAMKESKSGTIMGESSPGGEVIGFYRLKEAPWTLVLTARGTQVLAPINRFRNIFLIAGALFAIFILALIRSVAGRTVASIREVSHAARSVAEGDYEVQLVTGSDDEVGQLIHSFNTMVVQLEERMRIKEALHLAMEVQQNLLPIEPPEVMELDIAGTSVYCDETGGDYYDFLRFAELGAGKIGLAVGDVAGHGIPAALLMATARAMIRTRISQPGNLAQIVEDVNRLLCYDTDRTGDFMTLFLALLDITRREICWIRAGHAPAILYDWQTDSFEELKGEGIALGFDSSGCFKEYRYENWNHTKLLFIGTDGIWESENPRGEMFGMERLRAILRNHYHRSSQQIVDITLASVTDFRQSMEQEDDITMIVLKSREQPRACVGS